MRSLKTVKLATESKITSAMTVLKDTASQMDELWSFVDDKGNEQWVWLALDVVTREIVGCYIGDRSGDSAKALWRSLPAVYRFLCSILQCQEVRKSHQCHLEFYSSLQYG